MIKKETGQAFLMALILLGMGAAMIIPFIRIAGTAVKNRQVYGQFINEDYAADAAVEYGMWRLKYESGFAESLPVGEECLPFYVTINGVTASTTVMAQASTGQLSGQDLGGRAEDEIFFKIEKNVSASATFQTLAADGFESGDGSGGTGSWLDDHWTLEGDYDIRDYGAHEGTYYLRLYGDSDGSPGDGYAERQVDLSGSSGEGLYLQFYARVREFEWNDYAYLKVSTDGENWETKLTFTDEGYNSDYKLRQVDLSDYGAPSSLFIAFEMACSYNQDYLYIDDLKFTNSQETTIVEEGEFTEFTYYVSIQCMDPDGCKYIDRDERGALDRIFDSLPERGYSSGDFLQYVFNSTDWDEAEWGMPPFDPTDIDNEGYGDELHQELTWRFHDAGYDDVEFEYGEIKTMSFKAWAALQEGVYCNDIAVDTDTWGWTNFLEGNMAKITVGDPVDLNCNGGLLDINKTVDTLVIYPDDPTTVTYTITIENVDTEPIPIYEVEDWLPATGSTEPDESFVYVDNSAYGYIVNRYHLTDLFHDDFNRGYNNTVSGWTDSDGGGDNAVIYDNYVRMRYGANITQSNISTNNATNIVLSYDWRGYYTESADKLRVEWKPSANSTWTLLADHPLDYTYYWQDEEWYLPAGAEDTLIDIRFTGATDQSGEYARLDNARVSYSTTPTPVCLPDETDYYYYWDFFTETWGYSHPWWEYRWRLDWNFDYYPGWDDDVWDEGGLCEAYEYVDYDPYLLLAPGEIFVIVFQADVTLTASGSYYDEVFVRIDDWGWGQWLYSWPTGGVTVPQYDLQGETLHSLLRANAGLDPTGYWWVSWHWWWHW